MLREHYVDGAILTPGYCITAAEVRRLARSGLALAVFHDRLEPRGFDVVRLGQAAACYAVIRRMVERGRRRIAYIAHDYEFHGPRAGLAYGAYAQALTDSGLTFDESLVIAGANSRAEAYAETARLLDGAHPPDAIFSGSDRGAIDAIWAARDLGLSSTRRPRGRRRREHPRRSGDPPRAHHGRIPGHRLLQRRGPALGPHRRPDQTRHRDRTALATHRTSVGLTSRPLSKERSAMPDSSTAASRYSRRDLLRIGGSALAATAAVPLLASCSRAPKPASAGGGGGGTFTIYGWNSGHAYNTYAGVINKFEKDHGLTVNWQKFQWPDLQTKLQADISAGTPPDLVEQPGGDTAIPLALTGDLLSLDAHVAKDGEAMGFPADWQATSVRPWQHGGKTYGVQIHLTCSQLYYNKKMLSDAGVTPPATWDELITAGKKLTSGNRYAIALNQDPGYSVPWLLQNGVSDYDPASKQLLTPHSAALEAMQFQHDLIYKYKYSPAPTPSSDYWPAEAPVRAAGSDHRDRPVGHPPHQAGRGCRSRYRAAADEQGPPDGPRRQRPGRSGQVQERRPGMGSHQAPDHHRGRAGRHQGGRAGDAPQELGEASRGDGRSVARRGRPGPSLWRGLGAEPGTDRPWTAGRRRVQDLLPIGRDQR